MTTFYASARSLTYDIPFVNCCAGYGHEADWWALGILLYALVAGTFPVYGAHNHLQVSLNLLFMIHIHY